MKEIRIVCDCPTKDALVCKEHPDCRPSYCKLSFREQQEWCADAKKYLAEQFGSAPIKD
jgi:hypothetical protein